MKHMNNSLFHWGIPGMHWGVRRSRSSGKSNKQNQKQSHFSKSLQQKYGHDSVSSLVSAVKPNVLTTAKTLVKVYAAFKITELAVNSIPKIAWATGNIISSTPIN